MAEIVEIEKASVHPIAEKGFKESSLYDRVRPTYSYESVELLLKRTGVLGRNSDQEITVLELGAGTGLFTRVMVEVLAKHDADKNVRIIAIEPLTSMCEKLRDQCPGVKIKQSQAEDTGLADDSIYAIVAAHSFHWFANQKALAEIHRVLVPGGYLGLIWHDRDRTLPWVDKIDKMVDKLYELYLSPTQENMKWKDEILNFGKFTPIQSDFSLKKIQEGDMNFIVDRYMSLSFIASSTNEEKKAFLSYVETVLSETGRATFVLPHIVSIYWLSKL